MPLHKVAAELAIRTQRPFQVNEAVPSQNAQISPIESFLEQLEGDLFRPMRRHGKAAAVNRHAVAGACGNGRAAGCYFQLDGALARTHPQDLSDFLDQTCEHEGTFTRDRTAMPLPKYVARCSTLR